MFILPVQLTTSRIGNLARLIHSLLYVMTIHYVAWPRVSSGSDGLYLSPLSERRLRRLTVWSFFFSFLFSIIACVLTSFLGPPIISL